MSHCKLQIAVLVLFLAGGVAHVWPDEPKAQAGRWLPHR